MTILIIPCVETCSGCRGVVRLFNAVAKAQKQQEEAQEGSAKAKGAAQISKVAFLAELQGKLAKPQVKPTS